ncbi:MAG: phage major capsid protein [Desulfurellales bacterium]|nr:MAG: phage major capsid protein [Desulfurellales bacterium]
MSTEAAPAVTGDAVLQALAPLQQSIKAVGDKLEGFATKKDAEALDATVREIKDSVAALDIKVKARDMDDKNHGLPFNGLTDMFYSLVKAQRGDEDHKKLLFGDGGYVKRMDEVMVHKFKAPTGFHTQGNEGELFILPEWSDEILRTPSTRSNIARLTPSFTMTGNLYRIRALVDKNHSTSVAGGITVGYTVESGSPTASTAEWEYIEFRPNKVTGLFYVTEEMLEDAPAFASLVPSLFMEAYEANDEEKTLYGTGAGEPLGMLHANNPSLISTTRTGSGNTIDPDDILNLRSRIYGNFGDCYWIASQDIIPQLGKLAGADQNLYLTNYKTPEGFDTLLGRPILYTDHAPALAAAGDLALVNPRHYRIANKGGVTQQQSIHVKFLQGETAVRFVKRHDGRPLWRAALTPKNSALNTRSPFVRIAA